MNICKIVINRCSFEIKFYNKLEVEIVDVMKNERTKSLIEVKRLYRDFGFAAVSLEDLSTKGRKSE